MEELMNELVALVSKKTGLSKEMAQTAVNLVIDFLKKKLPAPIAGQIDGFLKNEGQVAGAEKTVEGLLSGFGKKK
jgi:nucleoid DNA-binding protein